MANNSTDSWDVPPEPENDLEILVQALIGNFSNNNIASYNFSCRDIGPDNPGSDEVEDGTEVEDQYEEDSMDLEQDNSSGSMASSQPVESNIRNTTPGRYLSSEFESDMNSDGDSDTNSITAEERFIHSYRFDSLVENLDSQSSAPESQSINEINNRSLNELSRSETRRSGLSRSNAISYPLAHGSRKSEEDRMRQYLVENTENIRLIREELNQTNFSNPLLSCYETHCHVIPTQEPRKMMDSILRKSRENRLFTTSKRKHNSSRSTKRSKSNSKRAFVKCREQMESQTSNKDQKKQDLLEVTYNSYFKKGSSFDIRHNLILSNVIVQDIDYRTKDVTLQFTVIPSLSVDKAGKPSGVFHYVDEIFRFLQSFEDSGEQSGIRDRSRVFNLIRLSEERDEILHKMLQRLFKFEASGKLIDFKGSDLRTDRNLSNSHMKNWASLAPFKYLIIPLVKSIFADFDRLKIPSRKVLAEVYLIQLGINLIRSFKLIEDPKILSLIDNLHWEILHDFQVAIRGWNDELYQKIERNSLVNEMLKMATCKECLLKIQKSFILFSVGAEFEILYDKAFQYIMGFISKNLLAQLEIPSFGPHLREDQSPFVFLGSLNRKLGCLGLTNSGPIPANLKQNTTSLTQGDETDPRYNGEGRRKGTSQYKVTKRNYDFGIFDEKPYLLLGFELRGSLTRKNKNRYSSGGGHQVASIL